MKLLYYLCFVALFAFYVCQAQEAKSTNEIQSCYYCESSLHPNCVDPYDKSLGSKMRCTEFGGGQPQQRSSGQQPDVQRFPGLFTKKSRSGEKPEYRCIKTEVLQQSTQTPEIVRMCTPVYQTVTSGCEYLKQFLDDDYSMKTCHECATGSDCNAGVALQISMLAFVSFLFLVAV